MFIERGSGVTNVAWLLVIMPLASTAKDRVVEIKAMNLPASNLTSKQERLGHAEESNSISVIMLQSLTKESEELEQIQATFRCQL